MRSRQEGKTGRCPLSWAQWPTVVMFASLNARLLRRRAEPKRGASRWHDMRARAWRGDHGGSEAHTPGRSASDDRCDSPFDARLGAKVLEEKGNHAFGLRGVRRILEVADL